MKKLLVSLVLIVALSLSVITITVFARDLGSLGAISSKVVDDFVSIGVTTENGSHPEFWLVEINSKFYDPMKLNYTKYLNMAKEEIKKLAEAGSPEAYFGIGFEDYLGEGPYNCYEYCPIAMGGYQKEFGKVTVDLLFATPYKADEKVVVMVGLATTDPKDSRKIESIEWVPVEGVGVETGSSSVEVQGAIRVVFDEDLCLEIMNHVSFVAIVSK